MQNNSLDIEDLTLDEIEIVSAGTLSDITLAEIILGAGIVVAVIIL